jgi:hypothetical protein
LTAQARLKVELHHGLLEVTTASCTGSERVSFPKSHFTCLLVYKIFQSEDISGNQQGRARLCHLAGGELEQIQFLLVHVSVQTTEQYLGCIQRIASAVNDRIGIEPAP